MEGNITKVAKKFIAVLVIILGFAALYNNIDWFMRYMYPLKYEESIVSYSREFNVDPYLVASVIKVESNFLPDVVSKRGAIGLMQIMPKTAAWAAEQMGIENFRVEKLQNPDLNIQIGTWYLSSLMREFGNDVTLTLAAYNGGRGNVANWLAEGRMLRNEEDIPFPETRNFVIRVKKSYRWYKRLYRL